MPDSYELMAEYDSAVSFYRKAIVHDRGNKLILQSYDTYVLEYDKNSKHWQIICNEEDLSRTTCRHIVEFLQQKGEPKLTKKELIASMK